MGTTQKEYPVTLSPLSIPIEANPRFAEMSSSELRKREHRVIGGDVGDLIFKGYYIENGKTVLIDPVIVTSHKNLDVQEVQDVAQVILSCAFISIGEACLY